MMNDLSKQMETSQDRDASSVFSSISTPELGLQLLHVIRHLRVNYLDGHKPEGVSDIHDLFWASLPELCVRLNPDLNLYAHEKNTTLAQMNLQALSDHITAQFDRRQEWEREKNSSAAAWRLFNEIIVQGHLVPAALERISANDTRETDLSAPAAVRSTSKMAIQVVDVGPAYHGFVPMR